MTNGKGCCTACIRCDIVWTTIENSARTATVTAKPGKAETEHVSCVLLPVWRTLVGSGKPHSLTVRWDLGDTERVCVHQKRPCYKHTAASEDSLQLCKLLPAALPLTSHHLIRVKPRASTTAVCRRWGRQARHCCGVWLIYVRTQAARICVCLLSAVFKTQLGCCRIETAGQRSRFSLFFFFFQMRQNSPTICSKEALLVAPLR